MEKQNSKNKIQKSKFKVPGCVLRVQTWRPDTGSYRNSISPTNQPATQPTKASGCGGQAN